jgi:hypothetical protein
MSMSTGDMRRQEVNKISTKAVPADGDKKTMAGAKIPPKASKTPTGRPSGDRAGGGRPSGGRPSGGRPSGGRASGKGKGKRPVTPVKVNQGINWGPVLMFGGAGLVAVLIIGFGAFQLIKEANKPSWQDQVKAIEGVQNFRESNPDWVASGEHKAGVLEYPTSPPIGGPHNGHWQNCMGDVYASPVPKEQATHSMEHGAVWVTYQPGLPAGQVEKLKGMVDGRSYTLMSPYTNLDKPISVQAWGFQLKVDNADDERIPQFISALRQNATVEEGATCSTGYTDTGDTPLDLAPDMTGGS